MNSMYHEDPSPPAVSCPRCAKPAMYVRTRVFEASESRVWMCENPHCKGAGLYFHTENHPKQAVIMEISADKQKALVAQFEIERILKDAGLPAIVFIGTPDNNGCVRASLGMKHLENRMFMLTQLLEYMEKFDRGEIKPQGS